MSTLIGSWIRIENKPSDTLIYMPVTEDLGLVKFYYLDIERNTVVRSDIYGKDWEQLNSHYHRSLISKEQK